MKKILSMLLVLCMALTLCSAAFAEGKSPVDGMTVAFIPKVSGNSFFEAANDGAQKYAKEWGLTVDYIGAPTADVTSPAGADPAGDRQGCGRDLHLFRRCDRP